MNSTVVRMGVLALAGSGSAAWGQTATQAPATAQAWDVQFLITTRGASGETTQLTVPRAGAVLQDFSTASTVLTRLGAGGADLLVPGSPTRWAEEVTVTMLARVAIREPVAGGPTWNTRNFGVSRVGGPTGSFFVSVNDAYTKSTGQGVLQRAVVPGGRVNDPGAGNPVTNVDVNGNPLTGTHWAFRQGFSPAGTGGSNTDPQNGQISNQLLPGGGNRSTITNLVQTRTLGYDAVPQGVARIVGEDPFGVPILEGDYAEVYSFTYRPKPAEFDDYADAVRNAARNPAFGTLSEQVIGETWATEGAETNRRLELTFDGLSVRYLFNVTSNPSEPGVPSGTAQNSANLNIPTIRFSVLVPAPGTAAGLALAALMALRRRRDGCAG